MNRNELLTGDQNILSRTKYFCPGQNFFCPKQNFFVRDKTFFVHAEGRGTSHELLSVMSVIQFSVQDAVFVDGRG